MTIATVFRNFFLKSDVYQPYYGVVVHTHTRTHTHTMFIVIDSIKSGSNIRHRIIGSVKLERGNLHLELKISYCGHL